MKVAFLISALLMAACAGAQEKPVSDTQIGGYGEINYNRYTHDESRTQMDLRRFVLSLNHRFSDPLTFVGEVEWEHAVVSKDDSGEVEIEQAYLNYRLTDQMNLKTGLFLMPFGFLNENHEPPVFYGVERNEIETRIIPSTWREGGIGLFGSIHESWNWSAGAVTGFDMAKMDDPKAPLAATHQELQKAKAQDLALFATLQYRIPGLVVGAGIFTGKSTQRDADYQASPTTTPSFAGINGRITLTDLHARWQAHNWDIQGLYTRGFLGNSDQFNDAIQTYNNATPAPAKQRPWVPEEFYGWLVQAAYKFNLKIEASLVPFLRYEEFNTQAKMSAGFASDDANRDHVTTAGLSFYPEAQVVFKVDYQRYAINSSDSRFDLGMGYMF